MCEVVLQLCLTTRLPTIPFRVRFESRLPGVQCVYDQTQRQPYSVRFETILTAIQSVKLKMNISHSEYASKYQTKSLLVYKVKQDSKSFSVRRQTRLPSIQFMTSNKYLSLSGHNIKMGESMTRFNVIFKSISDISERWESDYERLFATEFLRLR